MSKSRKRFANPVQWRPVQVMSLAGMRRENGGGYVRTADYMELHRAYLSALGQLERAGKRVARLLQEQHRPIVDYLSDRPLRDAVAYGEASVSISMDMDGQLKMQNIRTLELQAGETLFLAPVIKSA